MAAAIKVAKTMKKGQRLVVILADSVRNYMSKFLNDVCALPCSALFCSALSPLPASGLHQSISPHTCKRCGVVCYIEMDD